jgi:hypothetical protein
VEGLLVEESVPEEEKEDKEDIGEAEESFKFSQIQEEGGMEQQGGEDLLNEELIF